MARRPYSFKGAETTVFDWLREKTRPYRWLNRMLLEGRWAPEEIPFAKMHFSQFGEDLVLQSLFSDQSTGRWIDVGAFDPIYYSNTYLLYKKGWTGIYVEPNPAGHRKFVRLRERDINLNLAVGRAAGPSCDFWCSGPWSSLTKSRAEFSGHAPEKISVPVTSLQTIAETNTCLSPDLLTVDCEGHDLDVLQSADWGSFRPRCIVVEDEECDVESEIGTFLASARYRRVIQLGLSAVYIHADDRILRKQHKFLPR
jgi:FkbM family methyltransferase